jgi:hypothetical protein
MALSSDTQDLIKSAIGRIECAVELINAVNAGSSGVATVTAGNSGIGVNTSGSTVTISNNGVLSVAAGSGISVSTVSGVATVSESGIAEHNAGNSGTSIALNFTSYPAQKLSLTGNCTATISGLSSGQAYVLRVVQGSGSYTLTLSGVKWPGGTAPVISTASGAIDIINLYSDGTNIYGTFAQAFA